MSTDIDITQYASELKKLALQLKARQNLVLSVEELCSAGYEALQMLVNSGKYDSERGAFWRWAYKHVRSHMLREARLHSGRTRRQAAAHRANRAARVTARPVAELSERERFMQRWGVVDGTAVGYQLELADTELTPEAKFLEAERKQLDETALERLFASIKRLPERQRSMILQRYVDGDPLNTVAAANGISKSRASHVLREAREKLRNAVERLQLEPEL